MQTNGRSMETTPSSILALPHLIEALPPIPRALANRILYVDESIGNLRPPGAMREWIVQHFGSVAAVERQVIIKTMNRITLEGTLFNALRASRPFESKHPSDLTDIVTRGAGDPFCKPMDGTPEDVFGRVRGQRCVTASNIAKYDAFHGVVIFDEHNPLSFDPESVSDAIDVGVEWGRRAMEEDAEAKYFFFMWNCLWKSGASILHGHAQVAATRGVHYAKVEALRQQALGYRERYGSNYFEDLVELHRSLGLVRDQGDARVVVSLTPVKEKEMLVISPELSVDFKSAIAHTLERLVHAMGVSSFNLAIYIPPLAPAQEDWSGFPYVVRIVDRGEPNNKTADIGAMELYASSVVSSDPFRVAEALA